MVSNREGVVAILCCSFPHKKFSLSGMLHTNENTRIESECTLADCVNKLPSHHYAESMMLSRHAYLLLIVPLYRSRVVHHYT